MIKITEKAKCCGCGACEQVCPVNCIRLESDAEGFLYPTADESKCLGCGLCDRVCPIENAGKEEDRGSAFAVPPAFAAKVRDEAVRADSSSGGIFTLLAGYVLAEGGKVYGCVLDDEMRAVHIGIDNENDLHALRGSKYVQSTIGDSYKAVAKDLEQNKKVLFVGTPCQAAGLASFLGDKRNDSLIIVDFICHGVPSPMVFQDFIRAEEKKIGAKAVEHRFRNKDKGWSQTGMQLGSKTVFDDHTVVRRFPAFRDRYMNAFLDDICLRPSCYECSFKSLPKVYSDITIGDFWGIDSVVPDLNDRKGTSLVLLNTAHGREVWNLINAGADFREADFEKAVSRNKPLTESAKLTQNRADFFHDYSEKGYAYTEKRYMSAFTWAFHKIQRIFTERFGSLTQFIKFAVVGLSNTLIDLAVYYLLLSLGVHYLAAYTAAFLVSVCNAFFWNNKFVFKKRQETSVARAFIKSLASYASTFLLSLLLMKIMVDKLGISSKIAPLIKLAITIPLNFLLNKFWAFQEKNNDTGKP